MIKNKRDFYCSFGLLSNLNLQTAVDHRDSGYSHTAGSKLICNYREIDEDVGDDKKANRSVRVRAIHDEIDLAI